MVRVAPLALIISFILFPHDGHAQWQTNGVPVAMEWLDQRYPKVTTDGVGGAIVTWQDYRNDTSYDIYAQRIDAAGFVQWAANGVPLCTEVNIQQRPEIISDGVGGAFVTWEDQRNGGWDIFAQRISGEGLVQWTPDGVVLCSAANNQILPAIAPDGTGGAIVAWEDTKAQSRLGWHPRTRHRGLGGWSGGQE
jgi:predicted lipoprotein with Yx(FWY)xxD motif